MSRCIWPLLILFTLAAPAAAGENLLVNGDFEQGLTGWSPLWSRTPSGSVALDRNVRHGGVQSAKIEHSGSRDWSFHQQKPREVQPGQLYELSGWVRVRGEGTASLCVTLRDKDDKVIDWTFAEQSSGATDDWRFLRSRFTIPPSARTMLVRWIGYRPATVHIDDTRLELQGTIDALRGKNLPPSLRIANAMLDVTLDTADGTLAVVDRRSGRRWTQRPESPTVVLGARSVADGLEVDLLEPSELLHVKATLRLDAQRPEIALELTAAGPMRQFLSYPHPWTTGADSLLILPVNEGISYPAGDATIDPTTFHLYGGHGLCMGWYGLTDGHGAAMTIVETPDDARVRVFRHEGLLGLAPQWESQRGQFGPARRIRLVFFDDGGYVAMCKRYRQHARDIGLLRTLAEKRAANPLVDRLVGAVNVWCWDHDAVAICRQMQAAGIRRILWSNRAEPETLRQLNALGILTSRYDIYQDAMDPANFPKLAWLHPDWTSDAWPKDLTLLADGRWERGWEVEGKDGRMYPCGVLCDRQAVEYAKRRIPTDLKTHPYGCRFIDTTTAAPWRECYSPDHPMTRSESRHWKMELLRYVSEGCGLVTGSETGHEAAVPYVHYFEGMLSLGPYRVEDAGRNMQKIVEEVPPRVAKFQTGHYYRLPLWELVYHDCVVAQWYWGDYNNKMPRLWDRRDLWNALYGTPPMFMFHRKLWEQHRERFVASTKTACPVARATGYAEMLSHRWLTPDHAVQETRFANGVTVTVNFGDRPYTLFDGAELPPLGNRIEGKASQLVE